MRLTAPPNNVNGNSGRHPGHQQTGAHNVSERCIAGVRSDQSEPVSVLQGLASLGGKLPPFGQGDFPVPAEPVSIIDLAFKIDVIVARDARRPVRPRAHGITKS